MSRAAASTSLSVESASALAGLTSTAIRAAAGISSRRSSSRLAANSAPKKLTPVRLPLGRARLATRPSLTGSSPATKSDGNRRGRRLRRQRRRNAAGGSNHGDLAADQIGGQRRQPVVLIVGPAVFDGHALAFDKARLLQSVAKSAQTIRRTHQAIECGEFRSPAPLAAARAPPAATQPPRCRPV